MRAARRLALAPRLRRLARDRSGVAAIEFAFVLPVMLILLLGTFEVGKYLQTNNQLVQSVSMLGQMASQLPEAASVQDAQRIWSAAPLIAPEANRVAETLGKSAWSDALSVTITNVVFTTTNPSCTSACQYEAKVAWSVGQSPTPCGVLSKADAGGTGVAVPEEIFGAGSALWVRAALPYQPYLAGTESFLGGAGRLLSTTMTEASWFLPRKTKQIVLSAAGAASAPGYKLCPGVNA